KRTPPVPPTTEPTCSLSVGARLGRVERNAGTRPKSNAVTIANRKLKINTRPSSAPEITCGCSVVGMKPRRKPVVHRAITERSAEQRQQQALGEQLADDARPARANRQPERNLLLTCGGARNQQTRDVRACDQQHAGDDAHQQPERTRELLPEERAPLGGGQQ